MAGSGRSLQPLRTLIDTNVAIELANGEERLVELVASLASAPLLSVISRVEHEGGVYINPAAQDAHRVRLDVVLARVEEVPFTVVDAVAYAGIVHNCGFSRRRIVDRMIAAKAIAAGAVLATLNARDFRGIADLLMEDWGD